MKGHPRSFSHNSGTSPPNNPPYAIPSLPSTLPDAFGPNSNVCGMGWGLPHTPIASDSPDTN